MKEIKFPKFLNMTSICIPMKKINFTKIRNIDDFAKEFGCSKDDILRLCHAEQKYNYLKMLIPKKNKRNYGKFRTVYKAIDPTLELLQKNIATSLDAETSFPVYVQGFVRKRSIRTNASLHLSKKLVVSLDIVDFFGSITFDKVQNGFESIGCTSDVANILAKICTLNGFLPQGASTSPIIANLICKDMDEELNCLAVKSTANYSRYADDITFSGDICPSRADIDAILIKNSFRVNDEKFKIMRRGRNQYVTGLTVFDYESPRIPRRIKKKLRLILYYTKKYGVVGHLDKVFCGRSYFEEFERKKIEGWIGFIGSVEPDLGKKLKEQWNNNPAL